MKKMSLANIEGKLSRTEMRSIMAGSGTCSAVKWYYSGGYYYPSVHHGLSSSDAQSWASGGGNWCCASCGSASWINY